YLRDRRPRFRRPPEREAPRKLDWAVCDVAAQQRGTEVRRVIEASVRDFVEGTPDGLRLSGISLRTGCRTVGSVRFARGRLPGVGVAELLDPGGVAEENHGFNRRQRLVVG